ncbi:hypothetical protein NFI96_004676 [Prochilodus magdalenae]|nr:hypothetical protein NFI96_004676 [Prochilodus magdalenae]
MACSPGGNSDARPSLCFLQIMNFHHSYTHHYYGPMFWVAPQCEDLTPEDHSAPAVTILMENIISPQDKVLEYHHYYRCTPAFLASPWYWYDPHPCTNPILNLPVNMTPQDNSPNLQDDTWPEGFSMKGELRWGRLERVFGISREIPGFVKEDLRRVYGTYPSTGVSISYHRGEFVVRGDPRVGEQEYRVEKKLMPKTCEPCRRTELDSTSNRNHVEEEQRDKRLLPLDGS